MLSRMPMTATWPRLTSASLEENMSEPNPITFDAPQNNSALPVPFQSSLKHMPVRLRVKVTWMA